LLTGTQNKNPKISISCIQALTAALAAFGSKVVKLKDCLAEMPKLFQHRDKNVRNSAKDFFVEAYCWIGAPVKHALERVPKIEQSIKECEDVWKELKSKSKQKRFFKSQQAEREAAAVESDGEDDDDDDEEEEVEVDVLEFAQEVNFLAELGKARFGEDKIDAGAAMASKKWKERGEALDKMALILMMEKDSPIKLSSGDYMSVMTDIKTLIKKDTNVLLIVKAFKIVKRMAEAMRENFKNFGPLIMQEILARFKEKKVTVLEAAREAADAVAKTIKFPDAIIERVIECLEDKNPGVRSETMLFMYRCSKSKKVIFPKSFVKEFLTKVTKNIEHSDKNVRDEAYKMLAVMSTKLDLKIINTFISDFKEDRMKLYQAAVEELKGAPKDNAEKISKANEPPAPEKKTVQKEVPKKTGVKSKKPTKKPAASKKEEITESSGPPAEADIDEDTAIDTCNRLFGEEAVKKVQEKNWKTRLEGLQEVTNKLNSFEAHEIKTQPIYKVLSLAPGFKDTNFQCNQEKFKIIRTAAQNPKLSQTSINIVFNYCLDKISDVKCGALAKEALFGMADIVSLAYMAERVLSAGNKLKSVKNIAECWSWFAEGLPQFGFGKLDIKMFIDQSNIALAHSNAGIRTKAIEAIANVLRYVAPLRGKYDDQKDAIKVCKS
jgi:cytoskeleton-associated protein 5